MLLAFETDACYPPRVVCFVNLDLAAFALQPFGTGHDQQQACSVRLEIVVEKYRLRRTFRTMSV
jgi:hypothetical protein